MLNLLDFFIVCDFGEFRLEYLIVRKCIFLDSDHSPKKHQERFGFKGILDFELY